MFRDTSNSILKNITPSAKSFLSPHIYGNCWALQSAAKNPMETMSSIQITICVRSDFSMNAATKTNPTPTTTSAHWNPIAARTRNQISLPDPSPKWELLHISYYRLQFFPQNQGKHVGLSPSRYFHCSRSGRKQNIVSSRFPPNPLRDELLSSTAKSKNKRLSQ